MPQNIKLTSRMIEINQALQAANAKLAEAQQEAYARAGGKDILNHLIKNHLWRDRIPAGIFVGLTDDNLGPDVESMDGVPVDELQVPAFQQPWAQSLKRPAAEGALVQCGKIPVPESIKSSPIPASLLKGSWETVALSTGIHSSDLGKKRRSKAKRR